MSVVTIHYISTNYYFIDTGNGLLAFDAGWPHTYREYKDCLKAEEYRISDIKWLIVSHFHIDHAGLAGMFVDIGIQFFVFKNQLYGIDEMESLITGKNMLYHKIDRNKITILDVPESRNLLLSIGINGEVIHTNRHDEQSISLVLDSGEAFIGDLPPQNMMEDDDYTGIQNWDLLKSKGAKFIKSSHAGEYVI
jgi:glyoxylase-like metal-dependent hydrolase (beta-lactamase superfamily II)